MRTTLALLRAKMPELEVDGEMHGDAALDEAARRAILERSTLHGRANLLVCPNLDSASIAYNLLKSAAGHNVAIGPILLGCAARGPHSDAGCNGAALGEHDRDHGSRCEQGSQCREKFLPLGVPAALPNRAAVESISRAHYAGELLVYFAVYDSRTGNCRAMT